MFPPNVFGLNVRTQRFVGQYECYPVHEREDVERGGKIIMPSSALQELTQLNITYPMLFKLSNRRVERVSHCGVLEFVADEGRVYIPRWMMNNLALDDGDEVSVTNVELPIATYAKFQPHSVDFLDITDSKAVLENTLRNFACLTTGDCIAISYNKKVYDVSVLETRPRDAVCIIECDMSVEYVAPVDYKDPSDAQSEECLDFKEFVPFSGPGNVLVKKKKMKRINSYAESEQSFTPLVKAAVTIQRGVPDYSYTVGVLQFFRSNAVEDDRNSGAKGLSQQTEPFPGLGFSLRPTDETYN